jgi:hypothetical protein
MEQKRCLVLVDGNECGLPVSPAGDQDEKEATVYLCPRGHRSVFIPVPADVDPPKDA